MENSDKGIDNPSSAHLPENPPSYSSPYKYPPTSGVPYPQQYPTQAPAMGYPQPCEPPPGGKPYYLQPGVVYPEQPGLNYQAPQQQQQQQQQQVILMHNQQPVFVVNQPPVSMTGAIVLSCFVFWCFGGLFGGIAFVLAMFGQSAVTAGDTASAINLRNASFGVSIAGTIVGVIIIAIVAGILSTEAARTIASIQACESHGGSYQRYSCKFY